MSPHERVKNMYKIKNMMIFCSCGTCNNMTTKRKSALQLKQYYSLSKHCQKAASSLVERRKKLLKVITKVEGYREIDMNRQ